MILQHLDCLARQVRPLVHDCLWFALLGLVVQQLVFLSPQLASVLLKASVSRLPRPVPEQFGVCDLLACQRVEESSLLPGNPDRSEHSERSKTGYSSRKLLEVCFRRLSQLETWLEEVGREMLGLAQGEVQVAQQGQMKTKIGG